MASNVSKEETFQCSKCDQFLDLKSKTLPCLHSFCRRCMEEILGGNGLCPQCQEPATDKELRLAPFLVKYLRRRQLESRQLNCDTCSEDGMESSYQFWCQDCQKLLCQTCESVHPKHETRDLSGVSREEVIRVITMKDCRRHRKSKDVFCDRCNVCMCVACYTDHVTASPQCSTRPLSVREEASKGKKDGGPTLERELRQFEINIRATYAQTDRSIDQLSNDCESECSKLLKDFETFVEEARLNLAELFDNMSVMTLEMERKWRHSLKEREELLRKVKIWQQTLGQLLRDDTDDEDVVCGLRLLGAELSARLHQSFAPPEKIRWVVTLPKWCHDSLESLKKEIADWTAETSGHLPLEKKCRLQGLKPLSSQTSGHLQLENECRLQGSNPPLWISSIVASDEDNHVFVGDWEGGSILEFRDSGELVGQVPLTDGGEKFYPRDMCLLPEDILVVCSPGGSESGGRLFFLARQKCLPFLKKQKMIDTKGKFYSLCQNEKKIFACDWNFEGILCFNENGEKIKTILLQGSPGGGVYPPRLRTDPTNGNFLGTREGKSEFFVWNKNGEILQKLQKEEFFDFCSNKFGFFYFSSQKEIFSLLPKKKLYKFPEKSEEFPKIFVSDQKLFLSFKKDGKYLLTILKII